MTDDDEFSVFDLADRLRLTDSAGRLYGVFPLEGTLRKIGTCSQQIAEFPVAKVPQPWHGYPIWFPDANAASNRRGENMRPEVTVFDQLERAGFVTSSQRRRLMKSDHI